ncbi:hypothetical protein GV827_17645 [Sulfitobacter sp. JBTF-M27]|uniref:Uncharacterized protein n=1 Tax=Sulfitobacter sediminilitoris TaxID=2698830 RepID=A0A6P0CDH7_9RHOB|nr:hypothetical protein [Sulfitobacter sediminilitoris]NEK24212.1 hypothetical protein [Sulfitobacter sediminilitoris]
MSDPVTNAEVEDVLSSIRRLVSEDKRPLQASKPEPKNDRLVLTPALRVAENDAPDDRQSELSVSESTAQDTIFDDDEDNVEDIDAFAALDEEDEDGGIDSSLDDLITDDRLLDVYPHEDVAEVDDDKEADEEARFEDLAQDYSTDPYNFDDDDDPDGEGGEILLGDVREGSNKRTAFEDRQEIESAAEAAFIGEDFEDELEKAQEKAAPLNLDQQTALHVDKPVNTEVTGEQQASSAGKTATLSAKIEALETAIGNIADTWEPDDAGESDYAGTEPETMAWEDDEPETQQTDRPQFVHATAVFAPKAQAAASKPEPETEPESQVFPENTESRSAAAPETSSTDRSENVDLGRDLSEDEQLIDEEALRDLVSDIVRQELQGALGERITRNVRKLVRREIHRALTAQDLE